MSINTEQLGRIFGTNFPKKNSTLLAQHSRAIKGNYLSLSIPIDIPEIGEVPIDFQITKSSWRWINEYKKAQVIDKIDSLISIDCDEERIWIMHIYYYLKYLQKDFNELARAVKRFSATSDLRILEFGSGFGATLLFLDHICKVYEMYSVEIIGTELFALTDLQNQHDLKHRIPMFDLLKSHINFHNSPNIQIIPYHQSYASNKFDFPSDRKLDLIFSFRSFNYLYTNSEYEQICKTNLKDDGLVIFDFNKSPHHQDAPSCHIFQESSCKNIEYLKKSSPPNAYRLSMPKNSYDEYKGIYNKTQQGIFFINS